jgi:hypothetical protein
MKSRIVEHRRVKAGSLRPHPSNWRTHPVAQQAAIRASLKEIGFARSLLAYNDPEWGLTLIDGHLRQEIQGNSLVDIEIVDLTRDEARKLLATLDSVGGMAGRDDEKLAALVAEIEAESQAFADLLAQLVGAQAADVPVELKAVDVKPPPKMTWALIGIPTVRFGEIAERVEALAKVDGILLETTANDG